MSDLPTQPDAGPDRASILGEAYKRGLLPPEQRGVYEEGLRRGLIKPQGGPQSAPAAPAAQSFDTALSPAEEAAFTGWKQQYAPRDSGADYDLRGAFKAGLVPDAATGHWPDTYKKPNHPTFSDQSMYAVGPNAAKAGRWEGDRFIPPAAAPQVPDIANPLGAMGSAITRAPEALRSAQSGFAAKLKTRQEDERLKQGYEPGVDYDTGTGFIDAIRMKSQSNPAQQWDFLAEKYGPDKVHQDKRGQFYVETEDGKRLSPEGTGFIKNFLAGIYANAPQAAAMTAGGMLGSAAGPAGAVAGAGLGSMAERAASDFIAKLRGRDLHQTTGQQLSDIAGAGVEGAAAEAGGRLVTQLPAAAGQLFRNRIADVTPERLSLGRSVAEAGGTPPIRSLTPGLTSPAQKQEISARLGADWLENRNQQAVHGRLQEIVNSGMSPDAQRAAIGQILDPTAAVATRETGEPIVAAVQQHAAQLGGEVENLARDADRQLTQQLGRLNAQARRAPPGDLGEDVAAGIGQARTDFSTAMQKVYSRVDQLAGGQPSVPTRLMKREAESILQSLPKDAQGNPIFGDPRVLQTLNRIKGAPAKWTLSDAQAARSALGEFANFTDMTPGVAKRQFDNLRQAVDGGISQAEADPAMAPAVKLLRSADTAYAQGIQKFEDTQINRMVSQARTGIVPDPGKVADLVLVPGEKSRAATIKGMVGDRVWRRVAAADWQNIMATAADRQTGEVSARRLAAALAARDRGGLLELTYGPGIARDMRLYSQRLDARGGTIPASNLNPDNFSRTMRALESAQAEQDAFLKTNYLSALADPKTPRADSAVSFILKPGEETRLIRAQEFFGENSPQMQAIRDQAQKELLHSAIIPTQTGAGTTVAGKGIEKALAQFTPKQQEILFPGGLAEDMKRLAKEINFMFPVDPSDMAGSLIAGNVKNRPLLGSMAGAGVGAAAGAGLGGALGFLGGPGGMVAGAIPGAAIGGTAGLLAGGRLLKTAYYEGMGWIYSQPRVVRALSEGLRPGPGQAVTREAIRGIFRAAAAGELQEAPPSGEGMSLQQPGPQITPPRQPRALPAQPRAAAPPPPDYIEPPRTSVGGP